MKKIISFIMAVLILCALCVPAFAEDAKEVEPKKNSDSKYEIKITSPGNYIIKENCEVYSLLIKNCTLTIAEGVTVTVTNSAGNNGGVLNIGPGAVLECSGANFSNAGTTNVYGTLTFSGNGKKDNYGNGIINKYCSGAVNGSISSKGIMNTGVHDWKDGECTLCHTKCTHDSWTGNVCNTCKFACTHEHWTGVVCDTCHYVCPHGNWTGGVCDTCKYACPHESWTGNECDVCHYVCQHSEGTTTTVICNLCGGVVSTTAAGSTLSEGSLTIVCTVAGAAVGMTVMFFIMKKKKPAAANSADDE